MKTRYNVKSNVPSETRLCNFQSSNVYGSTCPLNTFFFFNLEQNKKTKLKILPAVSKSGK